jgi:hypothetical protein
MSKGKKGEGKAAEVNALLQQVLEEFEFTKPTRTNTPENGVDFKIYSTKRELQHISSGALGRTEFQDLPEGEVTLRQDHKESKHKINQGTAQKFVDDIDKNKSVDGHLLTGGQGLTSGAQKVLDNAMGQGHSVTYLTNSDLKDLANFCRIDIENKV